MKAGHNFPTNHGTGQSYRNLQNAKGRASDKELKEIFLMMNPQQHEFKVKYPAILQKQGWVDPGGFACCP
jgi:hypothetical protein